MFRVRFAPSPTGKLHIGGLRTALFNYLFAKHHNGKCILRIEDTDQSRLVEGATENLIESLEWSGIVFDEGPHLKGNYGPYIQSKRIDLYQKYAMQLIEQKSAYYCFCTESDLDQMREKQAKEKKRIQYNGQCKKLSKKEIQDKLNSNVPYVVRMNIDIAKNSYILHDQIRGNIEFKTEEMDDQVLLKSDGFPTYHLASVIDDHHMEITHVIRGEEWLSSTPKHLLLYEFLNWKPPIFAHLPLLLNSDRSKLSKRQGDVATEDYQKKGFLQEALINFIALLGWNIHEENEIFSMQELIQYFSIKKLNKTGIVFDLEKLKWMNQKYIQKQSIDTLYKRSYHFLPTKAQQLPVEDLKKILSVIQSRLITLSDLPQHLHLFLEDNLQIKNSKLITITASKNSQTVYQCLLKHIDQQDEWSTEIFLKIMKQIQKETGIKGKELWKPIRIAITLAEEGPDLKSVVEIFGKEKCKTMIQNTIL